jgi:twitching motility two-component system response regulator PilG
MSKPSERTVLVVDDEEDIRKTVAKLIEKRAHRVISVADGRAALDALEAGAKIDLVILDILMPAMDGYQTLAEMHARKLEGIPVIMLTAKSTDHDMMKGYRVGADYYITKPFKSETLLNIFDYLIGDLPQDQKEDLSARL